MNKYLQLPVDIELLRHPGQTVLRLFFHREALCDWCLGLCLLKEGLIETLTVIEQRRKDAAKIQFRTNLEIGGTVRVRFKSDVIQIEMTRNNLDYLQHFFLKYYRNSMAEVDHDLQAIDADTGDKEIYITFQVPDSIPSVSPEEARRRLGD